jgi:hypothetical protein
MINFKISDLFEGLITVTKPLGKPIPLNVGEIVKGEVMDLLSTGGVTLRIKGGFITARTDIPLQKDTEVMLKVIGTPSSPNELKLQFIGMAEKEKAAPPELKGDALNRLLQDFSGPSTKTPLTLEKIEGLLKALPADINAIPNAIRLQIQNVLRESLKATGQDIQTRLNELFKDLPAALKNQASLQGLKLDVTVSIDKLLSEGAADNLEGLLRGTGVALESKLKAVAELLQQAKVSPEGGAEPSKGTLSIDIKQLLPAADRASLDNDLKANLLRLKEVLEQMTIGDQAVIKKASDAVGGLLKDIETFQLLSRTTQSFYTFLPVNWQELRDGEIAFKQNTGEDKPASFSCRLNLDLEDHGKLVIMVLSHNNEFFVSLKPESEEFKSMLAANVNHLEDQFTEKGLNLKAVRVIDKEDTLLEQLENLEPYKQIVSIKA